MLEKFLSLMVGCGLVLCGCTGENYTATDTVLLAGTPSDNPSDTPTKDPGSVTEPEAPRLFMPAGGFYTPFTFEIPAPTQPGGIVYCTFNGMEPTLDAPLFLDPVPIQSSTVVRCTEFANGEVVVKNSETYFINESVSMPVVSIMVDPIYFETVVAAEPCKPDPCYSAAFWEDVEYPAHIEYYENGSLSQGETFEIDAGISIMGGWSRNQLKKSVSVAIRKEYQAGKLKYPLFSTRSEKHKFKNFILRNNGNRFPSDYVEDAMATSLLEGTAVDYQRSRQVVVFYNGEYYGIHDMREKLNEHFVETNYGIDSKTVDVVKHSSKSVKATGGSSRSYIDMLNFVGANDFTGENNPAYAQLLEMVDMQSFVEYMAAEIYFHNGDWPNNNLRAWHSPEQPWKFMAFDIDHGFDWTWNVSGFNQKTNMFNWIRTGGDGSCKNKDHPLCFNNMFNKLLTNPDFVRTFINRSAVLFQSYVNADRVAASVDSMVASIPRAEYVRDDKKFPRDKMWYNNSCGGGFDYQGSCLKSWAKSRDGIVRGEYKTQFTLGEEVQVTLASQGAGRVLLEDAPLPSKDYVGTFYIGTPMKLSVQPEKGGMFVGWADGSTENPRMVYPMSGPLNYTAIFK